VCGRQDANAEREHEAGLQRPGLEFTVRCEREQPSSTALAATSKINLPDAEADVFSPDAGEG